MSNISKSYKNDDGTEETLIITSRDDHTIDTTKTYRLANHAEKKESMLVKKFKGSLLGTDIGVKSGGFSSVAILALGVAVAAALIMYFSWKL